MLKKVLIILISPLSILSATVIDIPIEEKTQKPLQLTLSQINRIAATDGTITAIIGNPHFFSIRIDEALGQAFVTLKKPIETPEGMTVLTDSGEAQDFLVTSQEGEPTIVYLTSHPEPIETLQHSLATVETVFDLFEGRVPQSFRKRDFYPNETLELGPLLSSVQSISIYEGALETLYLVSIRSLNRAPLFVNRKHLETEDVNWILCPIQELQKNQEALILVSKRKD